MLKLTWISRQEERLIFIEGRVEFNSSHTRQRQDLLHELPVFETNVVTLPEYYFQD